MTAEDTTLLHTGAAAEGAAAEGAAAEGAAAEGAAEGASALAAGNTDLAEHWKEYIPEELKDRQEWNRVNSIQDLFKNYIAGQQTISKSVRIPDATSSAEEINAFYSKLGKPAAASDYTFEYKAREGDTLSPDMFNMTQLQELADQANLTKDQYAALAQAYVNVQNDMLNNYNSSVAEKAGAEVREAEAQLRKDWGKDYAANINNISAKITQMYPMETVQRMEEVGLFRDVNFLKSQLALTKMMTGDTIYLEGGAIEDVPGTIEALRAKRDELMQADYVKNKAQVNDLNKRIVELQMASQRQLGSSLR